ncbi:MAG: hypothetical protein COW73_06150 [Nitrospirae bacterium CG18_big_fil_WC_8_21_14_2_50_70_55]|nr:heavy-metal-associated domain-containing protein [Deltaproteobacteria bacterium]OIP63007.1 MAG: hypothetical protein AUK30_09170 [Nitrospirae bacterium CG2_30_70_394]PIQ05319.1 MAG: hypothetical protein COW73_06150 [Nitrospirae bacterium CG18_big_fil_WC_8_21_14_2_50_70_55]PIU79660.1 MAG: hypothetical protein COS73_03430 [Nitrospirae bacterium CG06_land_8_20_14_3_00_70_43]PIW82828.1 MAG: hypothetical protein COZ96_06645 [Nitrospirae bacterium CG_4_8_14_3_um_filter_70_85]PIX83157.1 MAG: hypot
MADTLQLTVTGMTCPHCEARVAKALLALPGVDDARADHTAATCTVTYDPAQVDPARLVATVTAAGYTATLPD